jgi:iron complex outermembrane receptor protein
MQRWTLARATVVAAALVCGAAHAEEQREPVVVLEEIEVKTRGEALTDTLEPREVRESSARDLGEALTLTAGVDKVRKGGIANDIVLRGMKRDDVTVAIDGAHVHGACPSRMDPPAFHLDYAEVDRVEVSRGPFDVTQPGGLGGVVDVRTRRASPGLGAELNLGGASSAQLESSGVASWGGERYDALVGLAVKAGEPFRSGDGRNVLEAIPATVNGAPNPARFRSTAGGQTAYDVRSGFGKVGFAPAAGHRIELSYTRQSAVDVVYPYLRMDGITDDTDRAATSWRLDRSGGILRHVLAQGYWSRVEHDMTDERRCSASAAPGTCSGALPRAWSMRTLARSDVWGGKVEAGAGGLADLKLGADFYVRSWDNVTTRIRRADPARSYADEASIPDVTIRDLGVYAEARRALAPSVELSAGARLDLARSEAAVDRTALYEVYFGGQDLSRDRDDVLASGNVKLQLELAPGLTAFAAWGHGSRLPDPQERYFALSGMAGGADWVGQPGLDPVASDELDLGVKWSGRGLLLQAQVFHSWLRDYVVLADLAAPTATGTRVGKSYANVDARTFGYEGSARVALPLDLFAAASIAMTRGVDETRGGWLAEMPPVKGAVSLRWDVGWGFAEVEESFARRQGQVDVSLLEEPTPAWWVTSVRAGGEWKGVKVFAGVRNLFDRHHYEHLSYARDPFAAGVKVPEPGRTLYLNGQYAL